MNTFFKYGLALFWLMFSVSSQADVVYPIGHFSDQYTATVTFIGDVSEQQKADGYISQEGYVSVYNQNGKRIIKESTGRLFTHINRANGHANANVHELPYGEQSILIYDDFNFDGRKDLALMDGQNSCYSGPSFQVYTGGKRGFVHNTELTNLAQNYCGMFGWDSKTREISTMGKSGCCWHQIDNYQYIGKKLTLVRSMELASMNDHDHFMRISSSKRVDKRKSKNEIWIELDRQYSSKTNLILEFPLKQSLKEAKYVTIYRNDVGALDYILTLGAQDDKVEYSYELDSTGEMSRKRSFHSQFDWYKKTGVLEFKTPEATFRVYDNAHQLGVEVVQKNQTVFFEGERAAKKGGLEQLDIPVKEYDERNYQTHP